MLDLSHAQALIKRIQALDSGRRLLQGVANDVLTGSKRAIFAFHRGDNKKAKQELKMAETKIKQGQKIINGEPRLAQEGSWRAAREENAEAILLAQYITDGRLTPVAHIAQDPDIFLGALSDLTGELVRRAVMLATDENAKPAIETIFQDVRDVVDFLLQMDLTGGLRSKLDQAKQNLRKLEEIRYDLAIHRR